MTNNRHGLIDCGIGFFGSYAAGYRVLSRFFDNRLYSRASRFTHVFRRLIFTERNNDDLLVLPELAAK